MNSYPEPMVARVINVSRETIAATRKASLEKAVDWTLENSVVCYSPAGLKKLLCALGMGDAAFAWPAAATGTGDPATTPPRGEPDPAKKSSIASAGALAAGVDAAGATAAARALVALKVTSISRNPSIVHATPDGGRTAVLVRVRTNANFTIGMTITARAPASGSTLYHFEGNCPRWKGRY